MVEARGVEPLSKNPSAALSPGAGGHFGLSPVSLAPSLTVRQRGSVASIMRGAHEAKRTHGRRYMAPHTRAAALPGATVTA